MENIGYATFGVGGTGLTNQIFTFINAIIIAIMKEKDTLICNNFVAELSECNFIPASDVINFRKLDIILKQYNLKLLDRNYLQFEVLSINYGTDNHNINITEDIMKQYYHNESLIINKNIDFNSFKGNPCPDKYKKLSIHYKLNNYYYCDIYNEVLDEDIIYNFSNIPYISVPKTKEEFGKLLPEFYDYKDKSFTRIPIWFNSIDEPFFNDILVKLPYNSIFEKIVLTFLDKLDLSKNINVVHLRNESDMLVSNVMNLRVDYNTYKNEVDNKFINIFNKYIDKNDQTILLTYSKNDIVINYLKENNYSIFERDRSFMYCRELQAIIDLLIGDICNNIFIGAWNIDTKSGSTFSYYLYKRILKSKKTILIDLYNISSDEKIL